MPKGKDSLICEWLSRRLNVSLPNQLLVENKSTGGAFIVAHDSLSQRISLFQFELLTGAREDRLSLASC